MDDGIPLEELLRKRVDVFHEGDVALEKLVRELVVVVRRVGFGERREDGLGGGAVAAYDDNVCVAFGVAGKGLGHAAADPRGSADEYGYWTGG